MTDQAAAPPTAVPSQAAMFEMISVPPPWLTQDYFKTVLQDYEKDKALQVMYSIVSGWIVSSDVAQLYLAY